MATSGDPMATSNRLEVLCAQADAARKQSQATVQRAHAAWARVSAEWQQVEARWRRAEDVRERWLSHAAQHEQRRYSAYARMQARLTNMPVIEQAKGILMAECGLTADQASDALRRAALRSQMRVLDLAATIVARTAGIEHPEPQRGRAGP